MNDTSDFGTRLRLERVKRGLYQQEMADLLGHSVKTEEGYERGWKTPSIGRVGEIAKTLGTPVGWLLGGGPTFAYECTTEDYIKVVNAGFQALADEIAKLKERKE